MKEFSELPLQKRIALEEAVRSLKEAREALDDAHAAACSVVKECLLDKHGLCIGGAVKFFYRNKITVGILEDIEIEDVSESFQFVKELQRSGVQCDYIVSVPYADPSAGRRILRLGNWKYTLTSVPS